MRLDVGGENAGRCPGRALSAAARIDEAHVGATHRKLVSDGIPNDAGADDRDSHVTILVGSCQLVAGSR